MLLKNDDQKNSNPVPHQRQEILKNSIEVIPPPERAGSIYDDAKTRPKIPRDTLHVGREHLEIQGRAVCAWDVVGDDAERDDHAAELAEAAERGVAC